MNDDGGPLDPLALKALLHDRLQQPRSEVGSIDTDVVSVGVDPRWREAGHKGVTDLVPTLTLPHGIQTEDAVKVWQQVRDLAPETGRWPVLMVLDTLHRNPPLLELWAPWHEVVGYEVSATDRRGVGLQATLGGVPRPDPRLEIPEAGAARLRGDGFVDAEYLQRRAEFLQRELGTAPTSAELKAATGADDQPIEQVHVAERWLHEWAMRTVGEAALISLFSRWRVPTTDFASGPSPDHDPLSLVLLPDTNPSVVAALGHFHLAEMRQHVVWGGLIGDWRERWGAEPFLYQGISVDFEVGRPPATVAEALPLAVEHATIGPYVLDGPALSLYEYAYMLVGAERWHIIDLP